MSTWRVELLGTLQAVGEGGPLTRFRTRRVALLLAHLSLYRNRFHSREELAELLWPEIDPEISRRNLRQALSSLRHVLEPPPLPPSSVLQVHQSRIRLNPEQVQTDVAEFEAAIVAARRAATPEAQAPLLRKAVDLYRGDLLPGFDESWVVQERLRLEDLYVFSLGRLISESKQQGHADEAIHYLRLAVGRDRFSEEWHVALMREYLASGAPGRAIRQYEELQAMLSEHFGQEPGTEAANLLQRARRESKTTPNTPHLATEPASTPTPTIAKVSLPVQITRFWGREQEIDLCLEQIITREARLTTILGPAGAGKTRLSVEVGNRLFQRGDLNVVFIPMADLADGSMVMDTILDAFKLRRSGDQDPVGRLADAAKELGPTVLILDNAEHIVDQVVPVVDQLLHRVPSFQIVVTSRQVLGLAAEHQVTIPPLPVPANDAARGAVTREEVDRMAGFPSVQLFVDRCQNVRPDFQLTVHNARAVATICSILDGLPLAIELAAGLSGSFAPAQMATHLQTRVTSLSSRRRDLPDRHRSLRAAIEYSYDTLSPEQRRFFSSLSVFRGGFSVDAAAHVCLPGKQDARELIWELQERSLLRSDPREDEVELRFRLLEAFREYGEDQLEPDDRKALSVRHANYFRRRFPASSEPSGPEERARRHLEIEADYDNFLAALDFLLQSGDLEACVDILETLSATWTSRGPRIAERGYIRRIADRVGSSPIEPVKHILLLRMLGTTYIRSSEYRAAYQACRLALDVAEKNKLDDQITVVFLGLATCSGYLGNLEECLEWSEGALARLGPDSHFLRARSYLGIGAVHWGRGESPEAEQALLSALTESAMARGGEPDVLIQYNLARICLDTGRLDEAMAKLGDAMRTCRRIHDDFGLATCLSLVSRYHWLKGQIAAALATGQEALLKYRETDFLHWSLLGIFQHSLVITEAGEYEAATTLLAATQGIGRSARLPDERDHLAAIAKIRSNLTEAGFERAWARGLTMGVDEAFRLALQFR